MQFSGRGFKEFANHAADRRMLAIAANLQALFKNAVPLYSAKAEKGKQQVSAFHYYGVKADFGERGQAFALLEVVERPNGDFFYDADATSLEAIQAASAIPLANQTQSGAGDSVATRSGRLAQWFVKVKAVNPDIRYSKAPPAPMSPKACAAKMPSSNTKARPAIPKASTIRARCT